jgi:nucleotide-binding universal stress UspA family protein
MSEGESRGRDYVVVGLDNHRQPAGLLEVAADEAERRGTELAIVTVVRPHPDPELSFVGLRHEQQREEATALQNLHAATVALHSSRPQLSVTTYCLGDAEVGPNREPMLWAQLLVIGTHGAYGRQALAMGSVSQLLLSSSRCPILVVPDVPPATPLAGPSEPPMVLIGVSEHPTDAAVVRAGYAESVRRGCDVSLVHAYSLRAGETPQKGRERARAVLAGFVAQAPAGTGVHVEVTEEEPAAALVRLAAGATVLVIGGRTGSLSGLIRESVSRAVFEAAPCPVLALPRNLTGPPGPLTGLSLAPAGDHAPAPTRTTRSAP